MAGRNHLEGVELAFLPDMEVVEVTCKNKPKIWIARDQVFAMEPEQDMPPVAAPGPVAHVEQPEPAPVAVEAPKPLEGARDSLSAPLPMPVDEPDLRPPPKEHRESKEPDEVVDLKDKFAKIGKKKRGRPKKVK